MLRSVVVAHVSLSAADRRRHTAPRRLPDGHYPGALLNSPCARTRLAGAVTDLAGQGGNGSWTTTVRTARGARGVRARTTAGPPAPYRTRRAPRPPPRPPTR